ncbi:Helicase associated domain protein [Streptomyces sp. NPDC049577]|uniref:helicase associated domain-containing protein n=1 Tax=Streptomyces sp. NPDC049577 TaxID=3155153 RepID=UPI003448653C
MGITSFRGTTTDRGPAAPRGLPVRTPLVHPATAARRPHVGRAEGAAPAPGSPPSFPRLHSGTPRSGGPPRTPLVSGDGPPDRGSSREARWQRMYAAAVAFHIEHHHPKVPHAHVTADGLRLGSWILHQRQLRSGIKPGGITQQRIEMLDAIGMRW